VAAYYRRNIARFHVHEQREFDIVENRRSEAIARRQLREAKAGKHLISLHEAFPRKPFPDYASEKRRSTKQSSKPSRMCSPGRSV
jgi:hypothetical protein